MVEDEAASTSPASSASQDGGVRALSLLSQPPGLLLHLTALLLQAVMYSRSSAA